MNGSMQALLARSLAWSPYLTPVVLRPDLVTPLWILACAAIAFVSARVVRRSIDHAFGVTVLASLLISPLGWTYYLWLAMPGCFALWRSRRSAMTWIGLLWLCVPLNQVGFGQPGGWATVIVASSCTWATMALWLGVVHDAQLSRHRSSMYNESPVSVPERSNDPAVISMTP
jgi:hypothetical protein